MPDKQLTDGVKGLLAKGLNFSVTPPHIPVDDFVVCTEKAAGILGKHSANAAELRAKVVGIIKHAKPPVSNISRDEREALKNLKADKDIIALPADKGRASVVLNKQDYLDKAQKLLDDKNTYEKLKKDPTSKYKDKPVGILQKLEKDQVITNVEKK